MTQDVTKSPERTTASFVSGELLPLLLTGGTLCLWTLLTVGTIDAREVVLLFTIGWSASLWGGIVCRLLRMDSLLPIDFPIRFLLGLGWLGTTLSLARWFLPLPLLQMYWGMFGVGLALHGALALRRKSHDLADPYAGLLATFLSLAAATGWMQHYFPPVVEEGEHLIYKPIRDQFIHTEQVTLLGYPGGMHDMGRYGLAGEPVPFYHYASYVFPALLFSTGAQSAYDSTVSLWLPLGLAAVGLAAYAVGSLWFGSRGGLWCLVAVLLLPDPSYWTFGLSPRGVYLYSFLRFLQMATANAYGIAIAGLGLAFVTCGNRDRQWRWLMLGVLLAACSLFFKAQVFLAAFPLVAGIAAVGALYYWHPLLWQTVKRHPRLTLVVGTCVVSGLLIFRFTHLWERTPNLELEWPPAERFVEFLMTATLEDPPALALARRAAAADGASAFGLRLLLVLFVTFRWTLIGLAIVVVGVLLSGRLRWIDAVPLFALVLYASYAMLLAPNLTGYAFGNPWDLQFVPFCWFYFLVIVWGVGRGREVLRRWFPARRHLPLAIAVLCLLLPIWFGSEDTDDWLTGQRWAYLKVPKGLEEGAQFIRAHAAPEDRFQDSENDPYYVVEALAERRAYAGWPVVGSYTARDPGDEIFKHRLKELEKLTQLESEDEIAKTLRAMEIRWYLLHPGTKTAWPESFLRQAAFESSGYRVYRVDDPARAAPRDPDE